MGYSLGRSGEKLPVAEEPKPITNKELVLAGLITAVAVAAIGCFVGLAAAIGAVVGMVVTIPFLKNPNDIGRSAAQLVVGALFGAFIGMALA